MANKEKANTGEVQENNVVINEKDFEKRTVEVKEGRGKDSSVVAKATISDMPRTLSAWQAKIAEIAASHDEGSAKAHIALTAILQNAFEGFLYQKLQIWKNQTDSEDGTKTAEEKRAELDVQPDESYSLFELLAVGKRVSKAALIERQKKELFAKQSELVTKLASGEMDMATFQTENAKIQDEIMKLK